MSAKAAFLGTYKRSEPTDNPQIVSLFYNALVIDPSINGGQEDTEFPVMTNINATPLQIEIAIRDALLAKAQQITGTTWQLNDIYQPQIRRG